MGTKRFYVSNEKIQFFNKCQEISLVWTQLGRNFYLKKRGNALVGIEEKKQLLNDPRLGSFWEGFALEEVVRAFQVTPKECYFWGTIADAELDLLIFKRNMRLGFEFKYAYSPSITKSMRIALDDLRLDHLAVICPGSDIYPLAEKITVYGLEAIASGRFQEKFELIFKK